MINAKLAKKMLDIPRIPVEIDLDAELGYIESQIVERSIRGLNYYLWHVKSYDVFIPQHQIDKILHMLLHDGYRIEYRNGITLDAYYIGW